MKPSILIPGLFIFFLLGAANPATALSTVVRQAAASDTSDDPVFFLDGVRMNKDSLTTVNPNEIAAIDIYKDSNAVRLAGPEGVNGVVFITTKHFARNKYWHLFSSHSAAYRKAVPSPEADSTVTYVLNGKVLSKDIEGGLFAIEPGDFRDLQVIDAAALNSQYGLTGNRRGVIIKTEPAKK
jgi:hypothetical protein